MVCSIVYVLAWSHSFCNNLNKYADISWRHHFYRYDLLPKRESCDIKNNAWVTSNNDFWSQVRWFANDFHKWRTSSLVKIIGKSPHEWPKIVIHGNKCIILFLTRYFMLLLLWRHYSWSVMSRKREVLALWRHIRQLFLHAQIGTKAIFTSE